MSTPSFDAPLLIGAQIEARAAHPEVAARVFLRQHDRTWTYRRYRDESRADGALPPRRLGRDRRRSGPATSRCCSRTTSSCWRSTAAARYAGLTLFGVNTGLRGETLAGVLNQSRARVLVVDERLWPEVERVRGRAAARGAREHPGAAHRAAPTIDGARDLDGRASSAEVGPAERRRSTRPAVDVESDDAAHGHLHLGHDRASRRASTTTTSSCSPIGMAVSTQPRPRRRTTSATPACRSSTRTRSSSASMPAFHVGGALAHARALQREQASCPTCFRYGVTFWNYVGEPVHYVLGRDREAVRRRRGRASAPRSRNNPKNTLRYAVGNGAARARHRALHATGSGSRTCSSSTARPRRRSARSARRAIRAAVVGEITDAGREDPERARRGVPARRARPRRQDHQLRARRSARSVASPPTPASSRATSTTRRRTRSKYRDGVYHSGDLGHVARARRHALPLLRRPHRRLDPQGRRELLRAAGRAAPAGASRRRARRRVRRAVRGVRRARHGGAQAARRRARSIRRRSSTSASGR